MNNYILSCCSAADMPFEFFKQREIYVASFHFCINGKEYTDDFGRSLSYEDFYKEVDNGALPTTSQINISEFINYFEPFLQAGHDILHVSLSSGLTGTFNSASAAAAELRDMYPERTIIVADSLCASSGYGLLIDSLYNLKKQGKTIDELAAFIEYRRLNVNHIFYTTDLTHFHRGGRISATSCVIGNLLNLCPFMEMDKDGKLSVCSKVRGKKKAAKESVEKMLRLCDKGIDYNGQCIISHSGCLDDALYLAKLIEEAFPNLKGKLEINEIGTVIGSHCGRGTVALFFYGTSRAANFETETIKSTRSDASVCIKNTAVS